MTRDAEDWEVTLLVDGERKVVVISTASDFFRQGDAEVRAIKAELAEGRTARALHSRFVGTSRPTVQSKP